MGKVLMNDKEFNDMIKRFNKLIKEFKDNKDSNSMSKQLETIKSLLIVNKSLTKPHE